MLLRRKVRRVRGAEYVRKTWTIKEPVPTGVKRKKHQGYLEKEGTL